VVYERRQGILAENSLPCVVRGIVVLIMLKEGGTAKQIARWVTLGALFLLPLTPLLIANNMFFPFITGKAFFFRIIVEIAFAGWLVLAAADKKYRPRWSWISVILVAFVVWMFIADLFAVNPQKAFWSNFERMEGWITLIHLLALFFIMSTVLTVEKKWRAWWYTFIAFSVYVIGYGLLQLAGVTAIHQGNTRIDASLGNAAYLAVYMLFNFFIASWLALTTNKLWLRYALFVFAFFAAWILFATATRGTILGLAGAILLSALLALFTMGKRVRGYAIGALLLIVLIGSGFMLAKDTGAIRHDPVLGRIASISLAAGDTRFTIWHMALEGAAEKPVFGWGQEGFNYVFNQYYEPSLYTQEQWFDRAHNAFVDWLVEGGVPAFLLYLALFVSALWALWRAPFSRVEQIAITALLAGYAFHNLFVFDNIVSYISFFAVLALIDGNVSKPIRAFERIPELSEGSVGTIAIPTAAAFILAIILWVDVPGVNAATGLITALSPSRQGIAGNIAAWKKETAHPAFAQQEVSEQLLTFAMQIVARKDIPIKNKQQLATLAINEMRKEVTAVPYDARLRFELAVGYSAFGDYKDSLIQMAAARALSPKKVSIIVEDGIVNMQAGNTKSAARDFKYAYELAPQFTQLASIGAAGNVLAGNLAAAQAILQKTFGTTIVDKPILVQAYIQTKQYKQLLAIFKQRVARPGSSVYDAFRLAITEAALGNTRTAITYIQTITKAHPQTKQLGEKLIKQIQKGTATLL